MAHTVTASLLKLPCVRRSLLAWLFTLVGFPAPLAQNADEKGWDSFPAGGSWLGYTSQ